MDSGYASTEIFKPGVEQPPVAETPVAPVVTTETAPVEPPAEAPKVEIPVAEIKPEQPVIKEPVVMAPVIPPAIPVNPLETLKIEDVAAFYKDKRDEVFKALGLDEFSIEAIRYYEATGGLADYAAVKTVDYSKMSDEQILRYQLREEMAQLNLEEDDLELMYESRIKNRFKLDEDAFSEREVKAGKLELKYEAAKLRKDYIENQKKFVAPVKAPPAPAEPEIPEEQQVAMRLQAALADPAVSQFVNGKKLILGSGDQTYNYEFTNPQDLLDILFIPEKYASTAAMRNATGQIMTDKNGNYIPDYKRLLKAAAILSNPDEYDKMLINYGKSLGTKDLVDKIENPANPQMSSPETGPTTVWGAMKRDGVKWV